MFVLPFCVHSEGWLGAVVSAVTNVEHQDLIDESGATFQR